MLLLLVAVLIAATCLIVRVSHVRFLGIDAPFGLQGQYFLPGRATTDPPSFTTIDRDISTARVMANWVGDPPSSFKVRWFGFLTVPSAGAYTFALEADDGAVLSIDDRVVVDNGGVHGPVIATGETTLTAGPHAVLVDYQQAGGGFAIGLRWAKSAGTANERHAGGAMQPIPADALSPKRVAAWKIAVARWLERATWFSGGVAILLALLLMWQQRRHLAPFVQATFLSAPRAIALALFVVLAIAETWPLASAPGRYSRNDNSDTVLNEWTISWVAHQAVRDPLRLFDANIFYPEPRTLAYSETMVVQSAMAAPILWLGGSPVLAYNLVLLAGFALSGWAMSLVLVRWTGSWVAALTGGVIFAFNAHSFTRLPHLQAQHVEFLPWALLALDALLERPSLKRAMTLAGWFVLQALTSIYLLVFTAIALIVATLVRPRDWWGERGQRLLPVLGWSAMAAVLSAVVLAPFIIPYWRVSQELGLTRTLDDAQRFVVNWGAYLATPARLHFAAWSQSFFIADALFPGVIALALAAVALVRGIAWRNPRARMCLAFGLVGFYLSFGPAAPGYSALYAINPLLHAIRAVSRFGYLAIVAVAVLAAFGLADVLARVRSPRLRAALALVPLLVALEVTPAPVGYTRFDGIPAIYDRLAGAADGDAVVVEFPFYRQGAEFRHAAYMLNSTHHWRPMLNGYSGFQPLSFHAAADALYAFPDGPWLEFLRARQVTHLFVRQATYSPGVISQLDAIPELDRVVSQDGVVLYRLRPAR